MTKERPILFNDEMVRAILAGKKTQTRRVVDPQPGPECDRFEPGLLDAAWQAGFVEVKCPYGQPGDRLWVRETPSAASCSASRILLEITAVRCERLHEITREDAMAEGIGLMYDYKGKSPAADAIARYAELWGSINGKKPGKTWGDNPWVWVIEFRRTEK